jgi:hypothetical protein
VNGRTVDYKLKLIEPVKTLINELTINFIFREEKDLQIESVKDRLVRISSISNSSVTSENLLNEVMRYTENRHSLMLSNRFQRTKSSLTNQIEFLNKQIENSNAFLDKQIENSNNALLTQIENSNNALLTQIENDRIRVSNKILTLNTTIPNIDLKIKELNSIILEDQNNLKLLESNPDLFLQRAAHSPTLNQVIHSYKKQLLDLEAEKINLLQEKDRLEQEKDRLESKLKLKPEIDSLKLGRELMLLESNNQESDEILKLSQEIIILELELEFLLEKNPTSTQLIGKIKTGPIDSKKEFYILLSFIFGLFLSMVIVLINNSLKAFKEE